MEQDSITKVLLWLFYVLVIGALLCYFFAADQSYYWYCGGGALTVRLIHYVRRFMF